MVGEVKEFEESMNISHKKMVSIPWEEYKELLIIKGRYEKLKSHKFSYGIDWVHKDSSSVPIRELNNPLATYPERLPRIEAEGK